MQDAVTEVYLAPGLAQETAELLHLKSSKRLQGKPLLPTNNTTQF
jgi:hypothetical protein